MRIIEKKQDNCPSNDFEDSFETICEDELNVSFDELCSIMDRGALTDELQKELARELIYSEECGATLRVKFYIASDFPCELDDLDRRAVYYMNGWDTVDAFRAYGDLGSYGYEEFPMNENDFGYSVLEWGQYILVISGFPA